MGSSTDVLYTTALLLLCAKLTLKGSRRKKGIIHRNLLPHSSQQPFLKYTYSTGIVLPLLSTSQAVNVFIIYYAHAYTIGGVFELIRIQMTHKVTVIHVFVLKYALL